MVRKRLGIAMSESTHERLQKYILARFGQEHNVTSALIQRAVIEFLNREELGICPELGCPFKKSDK